MDQTIHPAPSVSFQPHVGRSVLIDEACRLLGVSKRTVYYWIRAGRLQTVRTLGGSQRILLESIQHPGQGRGSNGERPLAAVAAADALVFTSDHPVSDCTSWRGPCPVVCSGSDS